MHSMFFAQDVQGKRPHQRGGAIERLNSTFIFFVDTPIGMKPRGALRGHFFRQGRFTHPGIDEQCPLLACPVWR